VKVRLERVATGRIVAGVCAGIGEAYGLDPTLVRFGFLLLALAWGLGVLAYGVLWLLVPEEGTPRSARLRDVARHNVHGLGHELRAAGPHFAAAWGDGERRAWPRPLSRRWLAVALVAGGLAIVLGSLGAFSWLTTTRAIGLAIIVGGLALLLSMRGNRRTP
jgi:phage shock protein PspC (stress-responsive transcriptional regulator)